MKKNRGFTLIELLVVIAVIGLLASVILASLNSARSKAQDAKIKAELTQVQAALEMYYSQYGTYKVNGSGGEGNGEGWFNYEGGSYPLAVSKALNQQGYLGSMPLDGLDTLNYMIYLCDSGQRYTLSATISNPSTVDTTRLQGLCSGPLVTGTYGKNYGIGN